MKLKEKRGTAMAEAALVFPLVTAAVIALFYILISMYGAAVIESKLHCALRQEEGKTGDTTYVISDYSPKDKFGKAAFSMPVSTFMETGIAEKKVSGEAKKQYGGQSIFVGKRDKYHFSSVYFLEEGKSIRTVDLLTGTLGGGT